MPGILKFAFIAISTVALLNPASGAQSSSPNNSEPQSRFELCRRFFGELHYTPFSVEYGESFWFDQDKGIKQKNYQTKYFDLVAYPGEGSLRLEKNPKRGQVTGVQLFDHGGDPRKLEVIENWAENANTLNPSSKPIVNHVYRYEFEFAGGQCIPAAVTRIDPEKEVKLFDVSQCPAQKPGLDCNHPIYAEAVRLYSKAGGHDTHSTNRKKPPGKIQ